MRSWRINMRLKDLQQEPWGNPTRLSGTRKRPVSSASTAGLSWRKSIRDSNPPQLGGATWMQVLLCVSDDKLKRFTEIQANGDGPERFSCFEWLNSCSEFWFRWRSVNKWSRVQTFWRQNPSARIESLHFHNDIQNQWEAFMPGPSHL